MRFHFPLRFFPIIPTPSCFIFLIRKKVCYISVDTASATLYRCILTPHKDMHKIYNIHTQSIASSSHQHISLYTCHLHACMLMYNIYVITYNRNSHHRRADVRSAPALCVFQVFSFFLCGLNPVPMQYDFPQPITHCTYLGHTQEHASSANCPQPTHASKYTPMYTCLHTRTYVRHTHSHTDSLLLCQYIPTYAQSRCLPTRLYTAEQPCSLTLCVICSHTHIERHIIIHKD